MTLRIAKTVTSMWRGTEFELIVQVVDEDGNAENMSEYTPYLEICFYVNTIRVEGIVINAKKGLVRFIIPEESTNSAINAAHDFKVLVEKEGKEWPVLKDRIGIVD